MEPIDWYMEPKYWPFIFVIANLWKYTGNGSIVYIATIAGFDTEIYESSSNRWCKQMATNNVSYSPNAGSYDDVVDYTGCRPNV